MKNKLLLIVFVLLIGGGKMLGQSFHYDDTGKSMTLITPAFEQRSTKGMQPFSIYFSQDYYKELFKQIYTSCLTVSQINILKNRKLIVWLWVNGKGEIFYVEFLLKKQLQEFVDEKELLTIYRTLRKTKFDLSKGTTVPSVDLLTSNYFVRISAPFVP